MEEFNLEEEKEEHKHYIIIGIFILIFLICSYAFYTIKNRMKEKIQIDEPLQVQEKTEIEEPPKQVYFKIDIKGAVKKPGVYELLEGSRVNDAIERAGGLRRDANTSLINLSKKIVDEMTIIIYTDEDIEEFKLTNKIKEYEKIEQAEKCPDNINQACINGNEKKEQKSEEKISLNQATKEQLMTLSGIGESKAAEIIKYRDVTPFEKIEDIKNIKGIGDSIFEKIKNNITI